MTGPTHKLADGSRVFPEGYDPADLSPLTEADLVLDALPGKLAAVTARFNQEVMAGCPSPKGQVDCDDKSQVRISNVIRSRARAAADGETLPPTVTVTMLDKSQIEHDDDELHALESAIWLGFAAKFARKQELEALAAAETTLADLNELDITTGWPS